MELNGENLEQLSKALRHSFTRQTLTRMLTYRLKLSFDDYVSNSDFQHQVFELIGAANREGWIADLILRARDAVPNSTSLVEFSQQFGLTSTHPQQVERIIQKRNLPLDPAVFRERQGEMEPRICRVEVNSSKGMLFGTGFLVSPSVVMTNYHVVEHVIAHLEKRAMPDGVTAAPEGVRLCFDFKRMLDPEHHGVIREEQGQTVRLADNWLIDASPNAPADQMEPPADRLDYALLRLDGAPGDETVGGTEPGAPRRGFVPMPTDDDVFVGPPALFILQHPRGDPLKLVLPNYSGTVPPLGLNGNRTRLRHDTNTDQGSSGSPCFTAKWELAALHHSGDPDFDDPDHKPVYNEAIPIGAILALIRQRGHAGALGAAPAEAGA